VVGLKQRESVYDVSPEGLTPNVLTEIYGKENWEKTIQKAEDDDAMLDNGVPA